MLGGVAGYVGGVALGHVGGVLGVGLRLVDVGVLGVLDERVRVGDRVAERLQHPGELAFTGEGARPILKLAQTHPLRVEVVLPVAMLGQVKADARAEITPESPLTGSWQARVKVVDGVLDSASGSFGVRLELPNPDGAIAAGVRCRVRFL